MNTVMLLKKIPKKLLKIFSSFDTFPVILFSNIKFINKLRISTILPTDERIGKSFEFPANYR